MTHFLNTAWLPYLYTGSVYHSTYTWLTADLGFSKEANNQKQTLKVELCAQNKKYLLWALTHRSV